MDYTIRIGGEAGQGLQTIGGVLAKVFSRSGSLLIRTICPAYGVGIISTRYASLTES